MNTIRLTPENAHNYPNHEIIFTHGNNHIIRRLLRVSNTGKTLIIDYPHLKNNLQIVTRKVCVILP